MAPSDGASRCSAASASKEPTFTRCRQPPRKRIAAGGRQKSLNGTFCPFCRSPAGHPGPALARTIAGATPSSNGDGSIQYAVFIHYVPVRVKSNQDNQDLATARTGQGINEGK